MHRTVQAAETYGALVEAAFDVHRKLLYQSLRWPLPENPLEERQQGAALSDYLWRGARTDQPVFCEVK